MTDKKTETALIITMDPESLQMNYETAYFDPADSLAFTQRAVDGYIERVGWFEELESRGIDLWCNEDGRRLELSPTLMVLSNMKHVTTLLGPLVFTRHDGNGNTIGLQDSDIGLILRLTKDGVIFID